MFWGNEKDKILYTIIIGLKVFLFDELKEKKENDNNCEQSFIFFAYMILFSTIKKNKFYNLYIMLNFYQVDAFVLYAIIIR